MAFAPFEEAILEKLIKHVMGAMPPEPTAHDWPHVNRVLNHALAIQEHEGGNSFTIALIAITHDLFDHKFFNGTDEQAKEALKKLLVENGIDEALASDVTTQVFALSFSKGKQNALSVEGKVVQDADRLEAIGAIGIARAFAYGGYKHRLISVSEKFTFHKKHLGETQAHALNTFDHFFEKLLKLYDLLNTQTARKMAQERFEFMQTFVKRFEQEWKGEY